MIVIFLSSTLFSFGLIYFFTKRKYFDNYFKRQGGLVVAFISIIGISLIYFFGNKFEILTKDYWSILAAGLVIILGGLLDDRFDLKPFWQFAYQSLAAIILLGVGDTIDHVLLPVLGLIYFPAWLNYTLSFLWIVVVINAFNWFDGLDGLAGGVGLIGFLALFFLSLTPIVAQPQSAAIALLIAGALLGFLFFNFYPARIYLGSVGSGFIALMLALLSIYSGGKVATAALVLGIPILDFTYVSMARALSGKAPWKGGDRRHLHYRLLDSGLKEKNIVILMYFISAGFGLFALLLQTGFKLMAFGLLVVIFLALLGGIERRGGNFW